mmetsp:Transcript_12433/g.45961  ORF Transcript_12433/g.45961 Transcript_12433/m.45961 type:complete len:276 (-) Transcript_12433:226-1053(-)
MHLQLRQRVSGVLLAAAGQSRRQGAKADHGARARRIGVPGAGVSGVHRVSNALEALTFRLLLRELQQEVAAEKRRVVVRNVHIPESSATKKALQRIHILQRGFYQLHLVQQQSLLFDAHVGVDARARHVSPLSIRRLATINGELLEIVALFKSRASVGVCPSARREAPLEGRQRAGHHAGRRGGVAVLGTVKLIVPRKRLGSTSRSAPGLDDFPHVRVPSLPSLVLQGGHRRDAGIDHLCGRDAGVLLDDLRPLRRQVVRVGSQKLCRPAVRTRC